MKEAIDLAAVISAAVAILAMLVFLITIRWAPRVATVASLFMACGLGICFSWVAGTAMAAGEIVGDEHSKLFRGTITREKSPVQFWWWVSFFGVPGVALVLSSILAAVAGLRRMLGMRQDGSDGPQKDG